MVAEKAASLVDKKAALKVEKKAVPSAALWVYQKVA